jgi:hypothetical protein
MLPCIVIDFFLNNQPDALIIPILFCYKILHVSAIFSYHHQEFSTVHLALVSFMQVSDDRFQAESGWNWGWNWGMELFQFHPDSVIPARFFINLEFSGHISEKYSYQIS